MNIDISISQLNLEYFLLVLVRITTFIFIAPFYGQTNVPQRVKLGLSVFLSIIIFNLSPGEVPSYESVLDYGGFIVMESITGLLIGFSAYICNSIILFAGRVIDTDVGLSMAQIFDPATNTQVTITGSMYQYFLMALMIVSNMHIFLLNAITDSFKLIPIGGLNPQLTMYNTFIGFLKDYFIIGFRIVLPIFVVILLLNCAMGIMTKIASQIHMFSVGIQIKVLGGFLILFATVSLLPSIANMIFEEMQEMVVSIIKDMN
ncbi:MAG: flagellar biosynthetic protein FliR [Lachnospiraceae bacterium]|nr:flagellar biosynthetic protein FliR [Lachnospiraceae bacterium]